VVVRLRGKFEFGILLTLVVLSFLVWLYSLVAPQILMI
jgi:hypothetical protein